MELVLKVSCSFISSTLDLQQKFQDQRVSSAQQHFVNTVNVWISWLAQDFHHSRLGFLLIIKAADCNKVT